jgi:Cft2 family RNA processing exonuclease
VTFHRGGIEVEGGLLWLDSQRARPLGVITHAHGDHVAKHQRILCTPETAALVRRRSGSGPEFLERGYGQPTTVGDLRVTLLPAGHILGSAMARVEGPTGSLLYTGDVRLEGGLSCPPAEPTAADLLITEATFGRPDFAMPPADEVRESLVAFARETLEAGETPVFLAYALGKAQEVMLALASGDVPVAVHGAPWALCRVYRQFGVRFPRSRRLSDRRTKRRTAIVVPPRFRRAPEVLAAEPLRVAAVTGWGDRSLGPGVDLAFQLSDHSDYGQLLRLVERVAPRKTYVLHGYAAEFAESLRERGLDAEAVPGHSGPAEDVRPGMFGGSR